MKEYVRQEMVNLCNLMHPHVVRFRECFTTKKYLAFAMEYAAAGNMYEYTLTKCAHAMLHTLRVLVDTSTSTQIACPFVFAGE